MIEANYQNVVEPILCTKIKNNNGTTVSTVEHLMAAFYGEGIDNALVEIDAPEVPILDGSASEFVEAIRSVGIKEQKKSRKFIKTLSFNSLITAIDCEAKASFSSISSISSILLYGTDEQKRKYIPKLATGIPHLQQKIY